MTKVRRLLTEVLLEVTTEEILAAAEDTYNRARSKGIAKLKGLSLEKAVADSIKFLFFIPFQAFILEKIRFVKKFFGTFVTIV